jgi:1-acyl-sn-glycerol-3-phosphate acyltransferase
MPGTTPLEDCVISFSQCVGAEKDSLIFLANHLGAWYVIFLMCLLSWCMVFWFLFLL